MSRSIVRGVGKIFQVNAAGPIASSVSSYHGPAHHTSTMNDLPIPQGSWQAHNDAKQRKYNMHLLMGIAFTTVTLVVAKASGLFHFNYSVPQLKDQ